MSARFALDVTYGEAKERAVAAWEAEYVRQLLAHLAAPRARRGASA